MAQRQGKDAIWLHVLMSMPLQLFLLFLSSSSLVARLLRRIFFLSGI